MCHGNNDACFKSNVVLFCSRDFLNENKPIEQKTEKNIKELR